MERILPVIESEVNNILSQMVDFGIILGVDVEDKDIYGKIVYSEDEVWPIELISGMERFIVNVAIRVALIGVSSLPRPNFLVIDEGFGSLDSENVNNLYQLFDYLKTQFDFILIVSHLDYIKDMVDSSIEITKEKGFSKVVN
jgi:DNA repair exonuclease SbcCD ATPase subunit